MGLSRIWEGLRKTREAISGRLQALLVAGRKADPSLLGELEEVLYAADLGTEAQPILAEIETAFRAAPAAAAPGLRSLLRSSLLGRLRWGSLSRAPSPPTVILVAGVNGSGKTTSIAKLAAHLRSREETVLLGACDTFRAAAAEQLSVWAERLGVPIVRQAAGADPAAAAFDAAEAAQARRADHLIVDTAGRLHTQKNLMTELEKIRRVLGKRIPGAPHEVLLVLDATTGQNAIAQAQEFTRAIRVTGLFLAKLDGTAKGGAVFGIQRRLGIPVKFVGMGEKLEDIEPFDGERARAFVESLLGEEAGEGSR